MAAIARPLSPIGEVIDVVSLVGDGGIGVDQVVGKGVGI